MSYLLDVRGLKTEFKTETGIVHAVNGISYTLNAGESLAIVGESGSGKSVGVQSIMGLIKSPPGRVTGGEVYFQGRDLLKLSSEEMRQIRGNDITMIFQDPMTSLNPVLKISIQLTEALEEHQGISRAEARERAIKMLDLVGLPNAAERIDDYPHQFSGGQLQRIGIAIALACDPALLIADEPTTALDVTVQAQIVELVLRLQKQLGMAIIWITHDLGVVAGMVEKVAVMYAGNIVELAPVGPLFGKPSHPYTLGLLESIPSIEKSEERLVPIKGSPPNVKEIPTSCPFAPRCSFAVERCTQENPPLSEVAPQHYAACWEWEKARAYVEAVPLKSVKVMDTEPVAPPEHDIILDVRNLKKHFPIMKGVVRRQVGAVKAVDGVSFQIRRGETLGLVGESGCGKSTAGRTVLRLYEPTEGQIIFKGQDLAHNDESEIHETRRHLQMIFQDPYASLNPRMTVGRIIGEGLRSHHIGNKNDQNKRVAELLELVGLSPEFTNRYPHEFSGGQRQRVGIARALATNPDFIIADEPISALDVSIQAQVVNLLDDLKRDLGLTYLFIAHDLSMVRYISDRIAVMYLGRIVELGDTDVVFEQTLHPYTRALLSAIPVPDPNSEEKRTRIILEGNVPNPANPPAGCHFHTRCAYVTDHCRQEVPEWRNMAAPGEEPHMVSCHYAEQFQTQ